MTALLLIVQAAGAVLCPRFDRPLLGRRKRGSSTGCREEVGVVLEDRDWGSRDPAGPAESRADQEFEMRGVGRRGSACVAAGWRMGGEGSWKQINPRNATHRGPICQT